MYTNEEIVPALWPEDRSSTSADVKQYIYMLRGKLETDDAPEITVTVRGFGYKLSA